MVVSPVIQLKSAMTFGVAFLRCDPARPLAQAPATGTNALTWGRQQFRPTSAVGLHKNRTGFGLGRLHI